MQRFGGPLFFFVGWDKPSFFFGLFLFFFVFFWVFFFVAIVCFFFFFFFFFSRGHCWDSRNISLRQAESLGGSSAGVPIFVHLLCSF